MGEPADKPAPVDRSDDAPRAPHSSGVFSVSVPIHAMRATPSADALAALAETHALDPSVFAEHPPFFLTANISNNLLDSYRTRMHRSSLDNYAVDAEAGVAVLQSHNARELPLGRSIAGRLKTGGGDEAGMVRVEADAYLMQGLQLGSVAVDQVVRGIRGGVVKDVSIGFYNPEYRCSVCGLNYWSWDCPHIPGVEYQPVNADGDPEGDPQTAFVWIHNARLAEFSLVYDGATPQAEVIAIKAQQEADAGRLRPETARLLEARYRIHLPASVRRWPGADPTKERPMTEPTNPTPQPEPEAEREPAFTTLGDLTLERAAAIVAEAGVPEGERGSLEDALRWMALELDRLRPLADTGAAYRADLIAAALDEGVRAFGAAFPKEARGAQLQRAQLDEIKAERDFNAAQARQRFPGGRLTDDPTPAPLPGQRDAAPDADRAPDAAYAAR